MKVAIIDNGTTLLEKLEALIPARVSVFTNENKNFDHEEFDLIILSGSSVGPLYGNIDSYKREIEIAKFRKRPLIGICFGAEIVAHAYGMELEEMKQRHTGITKFEILSNDLLSEEGSFKAYENHQWRIKNVSNEFEILAKSEHAPAIIKHKELPIYGFQFHPETHLEESRGDEIFLRILASFGVQ